MADAVVPNMLLPHLISAVHLCARLQIAHPGVLHPCLVLAGYWASSSSPSLFLPPSLALLPQNKAAPSLLLIPFAPASPSHLTQVQGSEPKRMLEVNWSIPLSLQRKLGEPGWEG